MNTDNHKRDKSGRFQKGTGGRPHGAKNKRKVMTPTEFSSAVAEETKTRLDNMLTTASTVLEQKLEEGDLKAALWLLENAPGQRSKKLSVAIPGADLSSIDGTVATAETVCTLVANGSLDLDEANRFLTMLGAFAQLRGFTEIETLKQMLTDLETDHSNPKSTILPINFKWGRIAQASSR